MNPAQTRPKTVMDPAELNVAEVYAQALLGLCATDEGAEEFHVEMQSLQGLLDEDPEFCELLTASLLGGRQKLDLVRRVFQDRVSDVLSGLLCVLARRDRLGLIRAVAQQFRKLLDKREGKVEVSIATAAPMEAALRGKVTAALEQSLAGKVLLKTSVDERLLGGLVLRVGDRVIDDSIRSRLRRLRRVLLARQVRA